MEEPLLRKSYATILDIDAKKYPVTETPDPETALTQLYEKVERLSVLCEQLREENHRLKAQQKVMESEREHCLHRTRDARDKVASMLNQLQSLNQQP